MLFSLRELRAIEEQRVADERAAVARAEAERAAAIEAAARRAREEEEARIRAAHAERLAIERAREAAEREARLRVEAAEAAERARQHAALEHERVHQELELRRAEVARQRPTWMVVVTGIALAAAIGLVLFAVQRTRASEADRATKAEAVAIARQAQQERQELAVEVERMARDLDELDRKVGGAIDAVTAAQTEADRAAAKTRLDRLRQEQAEAQVRVRRARELAARRDRLAPVVISEACLKNPLAPGCS